MARPTRAKAIPDLTEKTTMLTGDILLLTRLTSAPDDYENFRISWDNFLAQIESEVTGGSTVAPEVTNGDGLAIDYFESYSVGAISTFDQGNGWPANGVGTNCSIVSRTTHNSVTQKRCQITGVGEIGRQMPWGAKWNRIRIGLLIRINAAASFDGVFAIGVCSGTSAMYGSATPTNWAGCVQLDAATDTFTFSNSTQNDNVVSQSYEGVHRFGSTTNSIAGSFTTAKMTAPTTEAWLAGFFVDIYRDAFSGTTAVGYTHDNFAANDTAKVQRHMTRSHWQKLMQAQNPATDAPNLLTAGTGHPITSGNVSESAGVFDCINFYWANASNPIELAAFGVFKLY